MHIHVSVRAQSLSMAEQLTAAVAWQPDTRVVVNRHFFMTGEPVQFSVQALAGNRPSAIEKLAFLELFDRSNRAVLQTTITLADGRGQGTWVIPDTIPSDNYLLRVYTHAQKNLGAGTFRQTMLTIVNAAIPPDWNGMVQPDSLQVSFFPEGGKLVAGLSNRTAVRCSNQFGEAVNGIGYVLDNVNDTLARFATCCSGRADFTWTPESGKSYRLVLVPEGKRPQVIAVPGAEPEGYALRVISLPGDVIEVTVQSSNKTDNRTLFLVWGGVDTIQLVDGVAVLRINARALPAGRSAVLLFDGQGHQQGQRWWYTPGAQRLAFNVAAEKQYAPGQPATISIKGNNAGGLAAAGLTVSVYRLDSMQAWSSGAALQLASGQQLTELQPAALNLALLTMGKPWQGKPTGGPGAPGLFLPFFRSPELRFRIGNPAQRQNGAGVPVRLSVPGRSFRFFNTVSDSDGIARFPMAALSGEGYLVVTAGASGKEEIHPEPLFAAEPPVQQLPRLWLPESWAAPLRDYMVASQVNKEFLQKDSALAVRNDTVAFFGKGDKTYFLDEYTRFPTLEEVFREYVPEVNVRQRSGAFLLRMFNDPYKQYFDEDPLVLLDGIPVADINALMQISPLLIRKLQVVTRRFVHGREAYDGIINLTTYTGNYRLPAIQSSRSPNPFGQNISQAVSADVHTTAPAAKDPHLPDQRLQVVWLPHVPATKMQSGFTFITPGMPGIYMVVVEGLDSEGRYGKATSLFAVKP